jgi:ParB/RepB/Spo0J family partition protein
MGLPEGVALDGVAQAVIHWEREVEMHCALHFAVEARAKKDAGSQGETGGLTPAVRRVEARGKKDAGSQGETGGLTPAVRRVEARGKKDAGSQGETGGLTPAVRRVAQGPRKIVQMPVEKIHRHPANRTIVKASCQGLAEDLQRRGLLSPIQVRIPGPDWLLPEGHYQIVFGERRWLAAQLAGWDTIAAEVVELTDAQTLAAITAENGQREQLDDMQRIERLLSNMRPLSEGGGGMTQTEAAAVMGIDQSTASTLLKVGKLPAAWTDQIIAGAMTASQLRPVAKYADCPPLLQLLWEDEQRSRGTHWDDGGWVSRETIERSVAEILSDQTRALTEEDLADDLYRTPTFEASALTEAQLAELQIEELEYGGRRVRRCFNKKAWEALQDAARPGQHSRCGPKPGKAKVGKGPTPAELRRLEAAADKELAERIRRPGGLAEQGLRVIMAASLRAGQPATELVHDVLIDAARESQGSCNLQLTAWRHIAQQLVRLSRASRGQKLPVVQHEEYGRYTLETLRSSEDSITDGERIRAYAAMLILWPWSDLIVARGRLAKGDEWPDRWAVIPADLVAECAVELHVKLADCWEAARKAGPARRWLGKFCDAYRQKRQLVALCVELGVPADDSDKLEELRVAIVTAHHDRGLKLPGVLRDWPEKAKKRP